MASKITINTGDNANAGGGGAGAQKPVQLTDDQKKQIEDAFVKAVGAGQGGDKMAWISGGFSRN